MLPLLLKEAVTTIPAKWAVAAFAASVATAAFAQSQERMRFAAGNDNASAESSVRGDAYRDHLLEARRGQRMYVSLSTDGSAYFNVLPPGSSGEAIYNSSISGNDGGFTLPSSGDYRVRVYLMGADKSEARRVGYALSVSIE